MTAVLPSSTAPPGAAASARPARVALYTPEQRQRRDQSGWTVVQGVLAPLQFLVFLVSLGLVLRYLSTGEGLAWATGSVVLKTGVLYLIMVTGCIWEKAVFGVYLFAPAFYWEDVFSMLVLALHTAYVVAVFQGWMTPGEQMALALAAYAAYVINAGQFLWKLRAARLQAQTEDLDPRARGTTAGEPATGAWAGGTPP
ncbi:MAG: putative 2-vinyl bacteriochlorophyllide hydratase [Pseudomonadota bacterium]|jgi:3-vinyl bacteriochlorophyllide hydratase